MKGERDSGMNSERRSGVITFDPHTLRQDFNVLRRIAKELDGRMALDCRVEGGLVREVDPVLLLEV